MPSRTFLVIKIGSTSFLFITFLSPFFLSSLFIQHHILFCLLHTSLYIVQFSLSTTSCLRLVATDQSSKVIPDSASACCTISTPLFPLLLSGEVKYFLVQVTKYNGYFYITTLEITMSFTSFYSANWTAKTKERAC
jgi:hypothetical protein